MLTGGGPTGYAWQIGLLKGLHDRGIELREADLIVGTSAGSRVGAMLRAGVSAGDLAAFAAGDSPSEDGAQFLARLGPPPSLRGPAVSAPLAMATATPAPQTATRAATVAAAPRFSGREPKW